LCFAEGVVDDTAGSIRKRKRRPHAFDIGAEAAIEGQLRLADQRCSRGDGLLEGDILALHLRACGRKLALEAGDRLGAAMLEHFQRVAVPLNLQVVAEHAAERARDIVEQLKFGALAASGARG
jgi:hypothetical protein